MLNLHQGQSTRQCLCTTQLLQWHPSTNPLVSMNMKTSYQLVPSESWDDLDTSSKFSQGSHGRKRFVICARLQGLCDLFGCLGGLLPKVYDIFSCISEQFLAETLEISVNQRQST